MSNNFVFLSKMTVSLRLIIKTIIIDMLSLLVALDLFICLSSCEHYNFQTSVWYLWPVCLINLSLYALNLSSKKRISNFKKYLDEIYCTADHKLFTKNNSCSVPSHVWLGRFCVLGKLSQNYTGRSPSINLHAPDITCSGIICYPYLCTIFRLTDAHRLWFWTWDTDE